MTKNVSLFTKQGVEIPLKLTTPALRILRISLQNCFYTRQGALRDEPVGEIQIHSENGVCIFNSPANNLLPVIRL